MSKDNKIIYFNDVVNKKKVSNLKLFSGVLKNKKYKLWSTRNCFWGKYDKRKK